MKLFMTRPDIPKYVVEIILSEPTAIKWTFIRQGAIHITDRMTENRKCSISILTKIMQIDSKRAFATAFLMVEE